MLSLLSLGWDHPALPRRSFCSTTAGSKSNILDTTRTKTREYTSHHFTCPGGQCRVLGKGAGETSPTEMRLLWPHAPGPSSSKAEPAFPACIHTLTHVVHAGLDMQISRSHLLFSTAEITHFSGAGFRGYKAKCR